IFVVRWCGKTAGMLVAFQGFPAPPGGKKTGAVMENVFVLGYIYEKRETDMILYLLKTGTHTDLLGL
ncbi:MAG: hypothetical protein FWF85_07150, partial [Clostridiales bacterium]|nr:hypothetical protein [Clostridiales bacterium]